MTARPSSRIPDRSAEGIADEPQESANALREERDPDFLKYHR